jgi:starvation-inducible DNA-binding protein
MIAERAVWGSDALPGFGMSALRIDQEVVETQLRVTPVEEWLSFQLILGGVMKNEVLDIGLAEYDRKKISEGLSRVLADTYVVYLKTQNFHWNVTGPMFHSYHEMFERQYTEMALAIDSLAEHIRYLGFVAPASFHDYTKITSVRESVGVPNSREMVRQLLLGHESIIKNARITCALADASQDQATADLLTRRVSVHEKSAWMLRSCLEE